MEKEMVNAKPSLYKTEYNILLKALHATKWENDIPHLVFTSVATPKNIMAQFFYSRRNLQGAASIHNLFKYNKIAGRPN